MARQARSSRGNKRRKPKQKGRAVVSAEKPAKPKSWISKYGLAGFAVAVLIGAIVITTQSNPIGHKPLDPSGSEDDQASIQLVDHAYNTDGPRTLDELLELPDDELEQFDIAVMNLICAEGLPGAEDLDIDATLATLDQWAAHVQDETTRHLYKFRANPAEWENSEARWRMAMLVTSLQLDCGVHYNMDRVRDVDFSKSKDLYIHGMVEPGMKPIRWADDQEEAEALLTRTNGGTCTSMPVLYAVIGRRLGYPTYVSGTKGHLFCRWDGGDHDNPAYHDYFNVEGTNRGINIFDDDYYMTWPFTVTQNEVEAHGFFRSEDAKCSLATFMATRGHCLMELGNLHEALYAFQEAARLDPACQFYRQYCHHVSDLMLPPELRMAMGGHGMMPRAGESRRRQEDPAAWVDRINAENRRRMGQQPHGPPGGIPSVEPPPGFGPPPGAPSVYPGQPAYDPFR